jgi:hypothetical protein
MKLLKQSTAASVIVGQLLDANGAAVTTGVVGDFGIGKNGSYATLSGATVTHIGNGYYSIALTTGNTDTVGRLVLYAVNTSYGMATHHWTVMLASVFDALQLNATNTTGGLATATGAISAFAGAISTLTAAGVRTELTTELGRIDVAVSSRLATSGYTTPPTSAANATAVRTELSTELARIDVATSTRSTLTAAGVRTELATELGRIDTTISSRSTFAGGAVASVTGNVGGNVVGSVGSIAGVTFPTNFGSLLINASGHVSRVVLVDTTTTNTDMRGTDNAALASNWTATRAGYLDSVLLAANPNQRTVQVTGGGSGHIAADVHAMQTDVLTDAAIAASAVTKLQNGLATLTNQTAIKTTTDRLATMLVADGLVYQYTANALELAPGGGGGSGDASQTTLLEVQGTVEAIAASLSGASVTVTSQISQGGEITLYCGDDYRVRSSTQLDVTITDVGGAIYSRLNGIGVGNLSWGAARPVQSAGAISGTVASLSQAGTGASQTITIAIEIEDGGASLRPADDYVWQIVSSKQQGSEYDTQTEIEGTLVLRRRTAVPVFA